MAATSTERDEKAVIAADSARAMRKIATNRKDRPSRTKRFFLAVDVRDATSSPAPARKAVRENDSTLAQFSCWSP